MRFLALCLIFWSSFAVAAHAEGRMLLNSSYDSTREFYQEYNTIFAEQWREKTGEKITVHQSHGGSARQAYAIMAGLPADVVTLALSTDIDTIAARTPLIPKNWQRRLPHDSAPYTSTIVFLVRKGNPKHIKDWNDLIQPDVEVITPNPKTSGGARWNYLAAWVYATAHAKGDEKKAVEYMRQLFDHVPVLETGARGATTTFIRRDMGDVLITWENEAYLAINLPDGKNFEIVYPSISILAEPTVSVVDSVARAHKVDDIAWDYVRGLYSSEAQRLAANHYYRPSDPKIADLFEERFPSITLKTIKDLGGWKAVNTKHFVDGGIFDQIYSENAR